jgi:hypothetical protein
LCEHTFVRYSFTVTEHDAARPWIVLGAEQRTIELDDDAGFFEFATKEWPPDRFTVQLDP